MLNLQYSLWDRILKYMIIIKFESYNILNSTMQFNEDSPLGSTFYSNPYDFFHNYVRNMNNELFLSEYQINNMYALLLIGRASPWDGLRTANENYKSEVNSLIEKRIKEVKFLLDNLSQLYEDKAKKNTFNQIERLMSIIKAKNKSIFIQKSPQQQQSRCSHDKHENNEQNQQIHELDKTRQNPPSNNRKQQDEKSKQSQELQHGMKSNNDGLEVFGLISGLGNLPNLSALALGNCLEYNAIQRFIKFKMTKNYIMTIKNDDPVQYDLTSRLAKIPGNIFVHHIFPYLTAWQLFRSRSVCKQWLGLVKDSWHSTFKRQMYIQLLAGEFCKDIQFFYKCIQLRNPFFHKLSLLLHALIQIIEWQTITLAVEQNRLSTPCKRVVLVLLKLLGDNIVINTFNDLTEELWNVHKHKVPALKSRAVQFFANFSGNSMTINELRLLKVNVLDHPFMRGDQMQTEQKTPLLLLIFIKQLALQQILKNHLHFSQEYLLNSKSRLDALSNKMPQQRGFLEGVYKVLLMRSVNQKQEQEIQDGKQMPSFHDMLQAIFQNKQSDKPDFFIKTRSSKTSIFMDRATKLDIILSIVKKTYTNNEGPEGEQPQKTDNSTQIQSTEEQQIKKQEESGCSQQKIESGQQIPKQQKGEEKQGIKARSYREQIERKQKQL